MRHFFEQRPDGDVADERTPSAVRTPEALTGPDCTKLCSGLVLTKQRQICDGSLRGAVAHATPSMSDELADHPSAHEALEIRFDLVLAVKERLHSFQWTATLNCAAGNASLLSNALGWIRTNTW